MLLMLLIGLFTYRAIIKALGVTDYGVYSAVGGVVTMFMLVMNTVSSAISRYITVGLGKGDMARLKSIFGTSLLIMAAFCVLIVILTETVGLWYLRCKMVLPPERMDVAQLVLHTSLAVLVVNLLSVPYNAAIMAHEHMDAYAYISILEAILKLAVAFGVLYSSADKLAVYAWLLLAVAVIVRGVYAAYSMARFPESRSLPHYDGPLIREMGAFASWNFLGSGAYMFNTQGVNQLMNHFFGVGMNAARGVADKVEQIVRQFATNIALALNPQLTKSYVSGNKEYAFELVCKGSKYYYWVLLSLSFPFFTDSQTILSLWIGEVPPEAALFTKLTLLSFLVDFTPNTLITLEQAQGRIRNFYLITSAISILAFPVTWVLYNHGAAAWTAYAVFIGFSAMRGIAMLLVASKDTGLRIGKYVRDAILPMLSATVLPSLAVFALTRIIPECWWRFFIVAALGVVFIAASVWVYGLSPGEKEYIKSKLRR